VVSNLLVIKSVFIIVYSFCISFFSDI
jgi:dual specificity MAP kinase phosphatase